MKINTAKQEILDKRELQSPRYFTVKNFAIKNQEKGTWPSSESAIWALRAGSPQNGFGNAFITVGRRVLVDEEKFWLAVARLQGVKYESK